MTRRFLIDAQLPPALAEAIRKTGNEADHVFDLGLLQNADLEIWHRALKSDCIIITKDEDFATMRRQASIGPSVIWIRLGNTSNESLFKRFLPLLSGLLAAIENGETLIEIR